MGYPCTITKFTDERLQNPMKKLNIHLDQQHTTNLQSTSDSAILTVDENKLFPDQIPQKIYLVIAMIIDCTKDTKLYLVSPVHSHTILLDAQDIFLCHVTMIAMISLKLHLMEY